MSIVLSCVLLVTAAFVAAIHLEARWRSGGHRATPPKMGTEAARFPAPPGAVLVLHDTTASHRTAEAPRA